MRIRTILAAAAAPAIAAAALLATTGAASAATVQPPTPSAYFWQPNGHALGGPQQMPKGYMSFGGGYLAKVMADEHNANINAQTITITGHLDATTAVNDPTNDAYLAPNARVYFEGGSAGTNANSPDGYMSQSWWAHGTAVVSLNSQGQTQFILTAKVDPNDPDAAWTNWNGQSASDPANTGLFTAAASHVRALGLSFGGGSFFQNGVTGTGGLTIDSIAVG